MKKKGLIIVSLFAGILLIASFLPKPSQNEGKEAVLVKTVLNYVEQLQFRPISLDDKLSEQLFREKKYNEASKYLEKALEYIESEYLNKNKMSTRLAVFLW